MAKCRLASWEHADEPQVLTEPLFKQWQERMSRHRENVKEAICYTNVTQYEKEVAELEKFTSGHQRARKFKRIEEEQKLRKDNARLVQKICDVARESERRQVQIVSTVLPVTGMSVAVGSAAMGRRKRKAAIDVENARLLSRLQNVKSEITTVEQSRSSYTRHVALTCKMSRMKRPVHLVSRPPGGPPLPPTSARRLRPTGEGDTPRSEIVRLPPIDQNIPAAEDAYGLAASSSAPAPTSARHVVPSAPAAQRRQAPSPRPAPKAPPTVPAQPADAASDSPVRMPTESLLAAAAASAQKAPASPRGDAEEEAERHRLSDQARRSVAEIVAKVTGSSFYTGSPELHTALPDAVALTSPAAPQEEEDEESFQDDFCSADGESEAAESGAEDLLLSSAAVRNTVPAAVPAAVEDCSPKSAVSEVSRPKSAGSETSRQAASDGSDASGPQSAPRSEASCPRSARSEPLLNAEVGLVTNIAPEPAESAHASRESFGVRSAVSESAGSAPASRESLGLCSAASDNLPETAASVAPRANLKSEVTGPASRDCDATLSVGSANWQEPVVGAANNAVTPSGSRAEPALSEAYTCSLSAVCALPVSALPVSECVRSGSPDSTVSEEVRASDHGLGQSEASDVVLAPIAQPSSSEEEVREEASAYQAQDSGQSSASDVGLAPLAQTSSSEEVREDASAYQEARPDSCSDVELAPLAQDQEVLDEAEAAPAGRPSSDAGLTASYVQGLIVAGLAAPSKSSSPNDLQETVAALQPQALSSAGSQESFGEKPMYQVVSDLDSDVENSKVVEDDAIADTVEDSASDIEIVPLAAAAGVGSFSGGGGVGVGSFSGGGVNVNASMGSETFSDDFEDVDEDCDELSGPPDSDDAVDTTADQNF